MRMRLEDSTVQLTLSHQDNPQANIIRELTPRTPTTVIQIDASHLPLGVYELRTTLHRRDTRASVFEYPAYRIVKSGTSARQAFRTYIDVDNVLVMNGRRVFALGLYDTTGYSNSPSYYEPRVQKIAEAPLNLYLNYWLGGAPTQSLRALMSTLQKHGIGYIHTVNPWYANHPHWPAHAVCGGRTATTLGPKGFTVCMASELGNDPGLAGWYTADERPAEQAPEVFEQYTTLRTTAPGGLTFIAQDRPTELVRWRDSADVIGVDPYPIYNIPEGMPSHLEMVTDWVEQAQSAVERSRPIWAVVQFFKFGSNGHWPTYNELRTMSYMAIVAGAKGLFYWSYGAKALAWVSEPVHREEYWQRLVRVTHEIKSLERVLLAPDAPEILKHHTPAPTIRVLAKQVDGIRYIIAVNTSRTSVHAAFTLSAPATVADVVSERRTIQTAQSDIFLDAFAPHATHIYRIPTP
jgi:hypothetical protein